MKQSVHTHKNDSGQGLTVRLPASHSGQMCPLIFNPLHACHGHGEFGRLPPGSKHAAESCMLVMHMFSAPESRKKNIQKLETNQDNKHF